MRLISAARAVFAEMGPDVPLEEVASRASVSRTTLYRHFTKREELAKEIYAHDVAKIEKLSAELRDSPQGIVKLFEFVLRMMMDDRSLFHVVSSLEMQLYQELVDRMAAAFRPLVRSGKQAGIVRDDVTLEDFRVAFAMAQAGIHKTSVAQLGPLKRRIRRMLRQALFTPEGQGRQAKLPEAA